MKFFYFFIFILTFFLGCGDSPGVSNNNSDKNFDIDSDINPEGYRLIKIVDNRGYSAEYSYNNYGQVIKTITYNYKNEKTSESTYTYDSTNKVNNKITSTPNTHYEYEYSYNNNGQVISVTKNKKIISTYVYTYDNGKAIQRTYNNKDKDIYTYNNGNLITSTKYTIDDKYISKNIFTYDDSNQLIKNTFYNDKNNINYVHEYTHNRGKIISREAKTYKLSYHYANSSCTSFLSHTNIEPIFNVFNKSRCKRGRYSR